MLFLSLSLSVFFPFSLCFSYYDYGCDSSLLTSVSSYRVARAQLALSSRRGRMARKRQTDRAEPELTAHGFTRLAQL